MIKKSSLFRFIQEVLTNVRYTFVLSIVLSLVSGLMQSISVFLLFPLLESANIVQSQNHAGWITEYFTSLLNLAGLEKSLTLVLLLFVGLITLRNFVTRWHAILSPKIVLNFAAQLRKNLYSAMVAVDWLYFCRHTTTHFTQVLSSDIERIEQGVYDLNQLTSQSLLLLGYGAAALLIDWKITFCVAIGGLVAVFFQQKMSQRAYKLGFYQTQQDKDLYHWISESLNNLKLIKSSEKEKHAGQFFDRIVDANKQTYLNTSRHYANLNFYFHLYSTLILVALIYLSVTWFQLPGASLLILIFIFSRMMPLVSSIWAQINRLRHMQAAYENYHELYNKCRNHQSVTCEQKRDFLNLENAIDLNSLSFNYQPDVLTNVLTDINLQIPAGQITALLGISGAGKTTLCDLIAGLYRPTTGKIKIDNIELTPHTLKQWHSQIVYLTQDTLLFDDSIRNNLLWYQTQANDEKLLQTIKSAELDDWFTKLPEGLDTVIGERGVRLSGGEKQRLALARALLAEPTLLILDEASSAMDVLNEQKINRTIQRFRNHTTVIIIAHRLISVKMADNMVILDQGRIVEQGNWQTLSTKNQGLFQELLDKSTFKIKPV